MNTVTANDEKRPKHKLISAIVGEIWERLNHAQRTGQLSSLAAIPFEAEQPILDVIGGVLARYEGRILKNDPYFPAIILPRNPPAEDREEEWNADEELLGNNRE